MARPDFIPADLREQLLADAKKARDNGDTDCAERLREIGEYPGYNAPLRARELGVPACEGRYASAKELMRLIRMVEAAEKSGR